MDAKRDGRSRALTALQIAPWIIFGPITGACTGLALRAYRRGEHRRALAILVANVLLVAALPLLTALLASRWLV